VEIERIFKKVHVLQFWPYPRGPEGILAKSDAAHQTSSYKGKIVNG
jgi:hypothetical protein